MSPHLGAIESLAGGVHGGGGGGGGGAWGSSGRFLGSWRGDSPSNTESDAGSGGVSPCRSDADGTGGGGGSEGRGLKRAAMTTLAERGGSDESRSGELDSSNPFGGVADDDVPRGVIFGLNDLLPGAAAYVAAAAASGYSGGGGSTSRGGSGGRGSSGRASPRTTPSSRASSGSRSAGRRTASQRAIEAQSHEGDPPSAPAPMAEDSPRSRRQTLL